MLITDPTVQDELKSLKHTAKPEEKPKELVQDLPNCKHDKPENKCLVCDYTKGEIDPKTDHEIAKAYYIKYAEFMRLRNEDQTTKEDLDKYKQDTLAHKGEIIQKKQASNYLTMLWMVDSACERVPDDSELRILLHLFAKFYRFMDYFTIDDYKELTDQDRYQLERLRKHIFECQLRRIKSELEYVRKGLVS